MYEIQRIHLLSLAKMTAAVATATYAVGGLLVSAIWISIVGVYATLGTRDLSPSVDWSFAPSLLIGIPASAVVGFLTGAIVAFVYNIVARHTGGVKLDIALVGKEGQQDQSP